MNDAEIARALDHHRAGRLAEAEAAWRRALDADPGHAGVLHNLGVIEAQRGRHTAALSLFDRALAVRPDYAEAHLNRAGVLRALARYDDAIAACDRVIALRPDHPEPYNGKGEALQQQGKLDAAAICYEQALARHPGHYGARLGLGVVLTALGRYEAAATHFRATLALRRGDHPLEPDHRSFRTTSRLKLRHDVAQFRYLEATGVDAERYRALADSYNAIDRQMRWPENEAEIVPLPEALRATIAESYGRPCHLVDAPTIAGGALNADLDAAAIARRYADKTPGVAFCDGLLKPEALASLRRFLLGSTIWFDFAHIGGFLAAYLEDGMACPLLLQIGNEIRAAFPDIIRGHPLNQAWAFKCLTGERGIGVHADAAAISVNFWITPDSANMEPERGGLIVYRRLPPPDWRLTGYDADMAAIRDFVREVDARDTVAVPYSENRAVLFDGDLFHESGAVRFRPGYENHRINITLLYGRRRR
jgi:tetratricopeptide (TPR) repeat protein